MFKIQLPPKSIEIKKIPKPKVDRSNIDTFTKQIIKANKSNKIQKELEDSIKNKDFVKYNELKTLSSKQKESMTLANAFGAISIIKNKYVSLLRELEEYNPELEEVKTIERDAETNLKEIEQFVKTILALKPRIGKLNSDEQSKLNRVTRDIERFAIDLSKIEGLFNIVKEKYPKLPLDVIEKIKKNKKAKDSKKDIIRNVEELFKYGIGPSTDFEFKKVKEALEDPDKKDIIEDEVKEQLQNNYNDLLNVSKIIEFINNGKTEISGRRADLSSRGVIAAGKNREYSTKVNELIKKYKKIIKTLRNPKIKNIDSLKRLTEIQTELEGFYNNLDTIYKQTQEYLKLIVGDLPTIKPKEDILNEFDKLLNINNEKLEKTYKYILTLEPVATRALSNGGIAKNKKINKKNPKLNTEENKKDIELLKQAGYSMPDLPDSYRELLKKIYENLKLFYTGSMQDNETVRDDIKIMKSSKNLGSNDLIKELNAKLGEINDLTKEIDDGNNYYKKLISNLKKIDTFKPYF